MTLRFTPHVAILALCFVTTAVLGAGEEAVPLYKQPTAPIEARVEDLFRRMNAKEKLAQISSEWSESAARVNDAWLQERIGSGIGTLGPTHLPIAEEIPFRNRIKEFLRTKTRLGIPTFFHDEAAHGLMKPEATSFPAPIGLACTWDEALIERLYDMAAREARSRGTHHALAPVVDVTLDPRWGRTDETLGEDPFLNGRLGAAMVRGLQGGATGEIDGQHIMSTLKHLAGHGTSEGGLNRSPAHLGQHDLRETHLAPFAAIIHAAKPATIMPSYNEVDGIPSHSNRELLQKIVRGELGFTGMLVSDYDGIEHLFNAHKLVATQADAARLALTSGVQMELPVPTTFSKLEPLLGKDPALDAAVDNVVRAVLTWKFKMGMFEEPALDVERAKAVASAPASRELALQAARESIVLLKNDGNLLPLTPGAHKRIAVIGPNADVARLGSYSGVPTTTVSLLEGVRQRVGNQVEVLHAQGCAIVNKDMREAYSNWKRVIDVGPADPAENRRLIAEAEAVAAKSDLIILAIGEHEVVSRESWGRNHLGDQASLELLGGQIDLVRAMLATKKPVVVFLSNGRPLAIGELVERVPAILEGWYAGQETGRAAAEILFGDVNPSGKLTISFPRTAGHIPAQYRRKPYSAPYTYQLTTHQPLFLFGFGLSYTEFSYSNVRLAKAEIARGESVRVSVDLTNSGKRAGVEVVQLYVRDEVSSVTRPVKELRGFQRVSLQPGETKTVTLELSPDDLAFYNREFKRVVEPGWFTVTVGGSSAATQFARFEVKE